MSFNVTVNEEKCVGCEECVDVCPVEVFEMVDEKSQPVNADECLGCESCVEVCEELFLQENFVLLTKFFPLSGNSGDRGNNVISNRYLRQPHVTPPGNLHCSIIHHP